MVNFHAVHLGDQLVAGGRIRVDVKKEVRPATRAGQANSCERCTAKKRRAVAVHVVVGRMDEVEDAGVIRLTVVQAEAAVVLEGNPVTILIAGDAKVVGARREEARALRAAEAYALCGGACAGGLYIQIASHVVAVAIGTQRRIADEHHRAAAGSVHVAEGIAIVGDSRGRRCDHI